MIFSINLYLSFVDYRGQSKMDKPNCSSHKVNIHIYIKKLLH